MKPFIAFIVGHGMQHLLIHHLIIIPMQHLPDKEKVLFPAVRKSPEPPYEIMIQARSHIQPEPVNLKFIDPETYAVENMTYHLLISQVQLY